MKGALKHLDEWRDKDLVQALLAAVWRESKTPLRLMEVCGTHTVAIFRHGLRRLLPPHLELISGPGCPVCVTPAAEIDLILELSRQPKVLIASFGDLVGVPGSGQNSLGTARANQAQVRVVYSPMDALELARQYPQKRVVFPAIGFETTAPNVACTLRQARRMGVSNFFILPMHKLIPPAMQALLADGESRIEGFICPGHVSVIIGCRAYRFISRDYGLPAAVAGFEALDILAAVLALVRQHETGQARVENCYVRAVKAEGNRRALALMYEVFEEADAEWRGLGSIPRSGLQLRPEWQEFDVRRHFDLPLKQENTQTKPNPCACGQILKGILRPPQCPLFGHSCTPSTPLGPCMVSSEGSCAAYFNYDYQVN